MHDAPRYEPLEASAFFSDGQSARMPVANTVSRGALADSDELMYTGKISGRRVWLMPSASCSSSIGNGEYASIRR